VVGAVVYHQMQLAAGVGASNVSEEHQDLLMTMPRFAGRRDLAGGNLQRGELGRENVVRPNTSVTSSTTAGSAGEPE
jgi:hypothetical protein